MSSSSNARLGSQVRHNRSNREGICHICRSLGKLSFEHVPPEAAFNHRRLVVAGMADLFGRDPDERRGRTQQRGAGAYTLCEKCNSLTGHWYGGAYVDWTAQALEIARAARGRPSLYYGYRLQPLRVLKQILCMFFSANGPEFAGRQPELVRFVKDPERRGLRPDVQVFAFLTLGSRGRECGLSGMVHFDGGPPVLLSEVSFPPLGFVLCFDSRPPDPRLVDISFFAKFGYHEKCELHLRLPVLPVYTYYPGDFRSRDEVLAQVAQSQAFLAARTA